MPDAHIPGIAGRRASKRSGVPWRRGWLNPAVMGLEKLVTSIGPAVRCVVAKCNRTGNTFHLAVQQPRPENYVSSHFYGKFSAQRAAYRARWAIHVE
jgi:hypothetical protein